MIKYKVNIMEKLKEKGFSANRMRKEKILSESTMQRLRTGGGITTESLNVICCILRCQISDIIEVQPTDEEKIKYF